MASIRVLDKDAAIWLLSRDEAPVEPSVGDVFTAHIEGTHTEVDYTVLRVVQEAGEFVVFCRRVEDEP